MTCAVLSLHPLLSVHDTAVFLSPEYPKKRLLAGAKPDISRGSLWAASSGTSTAAGVSDSLTGLQRCGGRASKRCWPPVDNIHWPAAGHRPGWARTGRDRDTWDRLQQQDVQCKQGERATGGGVTPKIKKE